MARLDEGSPRGLGGRPDDGSTGDPARQHALSARLSGLSARIRTLAARVQGLAARIPILTRRQVFYAGLLIGAAAFLFLYGLLPLNVCDDSWLVGNGGDLTQHYLGWVYFRKTPWAFPIGLVSGITYPDQLCITYMDSIPILAVLFKLLSPILPATFQYFGLYGLATFMLQGGLGAALVHSRTRDDKVSVLASGFFVFSTILMRRMFSHTSLACNPLLLAALYLYLNRDELGCELRRLALWTGLLALASVVHLYYIPMVGVLLAASYFWDIFSRRCLRGLAGVAIPCAVTLLVMFVMGDFYGAVSLAGTGLGEYSADLNALFNSQGTSLIGSYLGVSSSGLGEEYAYLGAGIMALALLALVDLCERRGWRELTRASVPTVLVVISFLLLAAEPVVRLGGTELFTISYPARMGRILAIFRTNARFMWPLFYLVMIGSIARVAGRYRAPACVIAAALALQIVDLPQIGALHEAWRALPETQAQERVLTSAAWDELADKQELYFFYDPVSEYGMLSATYGLGALAAEHDMVMNDFYVARKDSARLDAEKQAEYERILGGEVDAGRMYVFARMPADLLLNAPALHIYRIDGIYVGLADELSAPGAELLGRDVVDYDLADFQMAYGDYLDEGRVLAHDGVLYGPYLRLKAGSYRVTVTGENLAGGLYEVVSHEVAAPMHGLSRSYDEVSYLFTLEEDGEDLELRCTNRHPSSLYISGLTLEKVDATGDGDAGLATDAVGLSEAPTASESKGVPVGTEADTW